MKNIKKITIFLTLILFVLIFFACPNPVNNPVKVTNPYNNIQQSLSENFGPDESWTFMIYIDADNNLEANALDDIREMKSGLNGLGNSNINVVVLIDRINEYSSDPFPETDTDWTGARIYQINQDNTITKKTDGWFTDGSEINMGDPDTLKSFINYCKTNYNSVHYALILWNHGGGARSRSINTQDLNQTEKAVCWDDTDNSDCLYLDEVQQAISQYFNSSSKLDFLGFDACLMGMVEIAYEFRDLALVMAGSMATEWGNGWDYENLFKLMGNNNNNDPKELGKLVVKTYHDSTTTQTDQTQVAVDLTKIIDLKTAIDSFAIALYNENKKTNIETVRDFSYHFYTDDDEAVFYPFYDLNDFAYQIYGNSSIFSSYLVDSANAVIAALSNAVIAAYAGSYYGNYYGAGSSVKRGLSIFFSRGNLVYNNYSHYAYQYWYTNIDIIGMLGSNYPYGKIDFANSDADGIVKTWRELFEFWYDPANNLTPGSY